jgi:hypothetical protein
VSPRSSLAFSSVYSGAFRRMRPVTRSDDSDRMTWATPAFLDRLGSTRIARSCVAAGRSRAPRSGGRRQPERNFPLNAPGNPTRIMTQIMAQIRLAYLFESHSRDPTRIMGRIWRAGEFLLPSSTGVRQSQHVEASDEPRLLRILRWRREGRNRRAGARWHRLGAACPTQQQRLCWAVRAQQDCAAAF